MNNINLKLAQNDIEEALETIEAMEATLSTSSLSKNDLKEQFELLASKVDRLEKILIEEGIINN